MVLCRVAGSRLRQEVLAVEPMKPYDRSVQVVWDCLQAALS